MQLRGVASLVNWSLTPILHSDDRAAGFNSCWRHRTGARHDATARDVGITREGLYKALGEQGNPSFATVVKVMKALGLQFNVGARSMQD